MFALADEDLVKKPILLAQWNSLFEAKQGGKPDFNLFVETIRLNESVRNTNTILSTNKRHMHPL